MNVLTEILLPLVGFMVLGFGFLWKRIDGVETRLGAKIDGVETRLETKIDRLTDIYINHLEHAHGQGR